jgi:hypothetical protein
MSGDPPRVDANIMTACAVDAMNAALAIARAAFVVFHEVMRSMLSRPDAAGQRTALIE